MQQTTGAGTSAAADNELEREQLTHWHRPSAVEQKLSACALLCMLQNNPPPLNNSSRTILWFRNKSNSGTNADHETEQDCTGKQLVLVRGLLQVPYAGTAILHTPATAVSCCLQRALHAAMLCMLTTCHQKSVLS
jgi:hypothetical protein